MPRNQLDEQKRYDLRKQLVQRGIVLDPVAKPPRESWPIAVGLDPNPLSSILFPIWNNCATACCIWVEFVATTRSAPYIDEVSLWLPFGDAPFEWWLDPRYTTQKKHYDFPGGLSFPRNNVMNHRLKHALQPGGPMEGYLLGVSQQRLPATVCSPVAAKLVIFDAAGQMLARKAVSLAVVSSMDETPVGVERPTPLFQAEEESEVDHEVHPGSNGRFQ